MAIQFDAATRNAMADAITSAVGSNALLKIYAGSVPANVAAAAGTELVSLPCSATFAPAASGGVLTLNAITPTSASATGTAAYFRITTSGGTAKLQGTVGTSGADLNLDTVSLVSGSPVAINSAAFTMPGA
jgi:hypothetical protein